MIDLKVKKDAKKPEKNENKKHASKKAKSRTEHLDDGKPSNYSDNSPADKPGFGDDVPAFFK